MLDCVLSVRRARRTLVVAFALAAVATCARAASSPQVADFKLANGLEVVVLPDHRAPVVTHMIWYKVGAADETPGKSGLAHYLEHLMFKGTVKNPGNTFSQAVAAIGGEENAFTASDYTGFYERVPREHLKEMMAFEADRMTNLVLTDAVARPELKVVLEELNMRVANNPGARLDEQMDAALYLNHPYHRPVIGWRHEVEKLSRDDALAFYRRFYTPNNAIVVVAGDVTPDEVKTDAEATYGKVPVRSRNRPAGAADRAGAGRAAHRDAGGCARRAAERQRYYLAPSASTAKPGEEEALDVLATVLGRDANSRLYKTLVMDKGLALNAGSFYSDTALDYGKFGVYASPKPGVTLHTVEAAMDGVLNDVIEHGITADELNRAKTGLIADAVYAQDNQATLARWYGAGLTTGQTVAEVERLARPGACGDGCAGAGGRAAMARHPPVGHRLSQ